MPSTSKKQHNFMEAIAHSPAFAKKVGVSQSVGKDFSKADKGKTFSRGGDMAMDPKMMAMMMAKKKAAGARPGMAEPGTPPMMKKGGKVKKMATGGFTKAADGVAQRGKTKATQIKMSRGGKAC
jgi:hypothetical protein